MKKLGNIFRPAILFPLVCLAFGLDFVACVTRALQQMAANADVELVLPEAMLNSINTATPVAA